MTAAHQTGFDFAPKARQEPWMQPASTGDTRRTAHERQTAKRKERTWQRIMEYIRAHGDATADEITAAWDASPNSIAPRCCELLKLGRLVKTGEYRETRYGCKAAVVKELANG